MERLGRSQPVCCFGDLDCRASFFPDVAAKGFFAPSPARGTYNCRPRHHVPTAWSTVAFEQGMLRNTHQSLWHICSLNCSPRLDTSRFSSGLPVFVVRLRSLLRVASASTKACFSVSRVGAVHQTFCAILSGRLGRFRPSATWVRTTSLSAAVWHSVSVVGTVCLPIRYGHCGRMVRFCLSCLCLYEGTLLDCCAALSCLCLYEGMLLRFCVWPSVSRRPSSNVHASGHRAKPLGVMTLLPAAEPLPLRRQASHSFPVFPFWYQSRIARSGVFLFPKSVMPGDG